MAHVMDDSGGSDPGVTKGVVAMPDAESLRRSVAAANGMNQGRPGNTPAGHAQSALEATAAPVSATSSGTAAFAMPAAILKAEHTAATAQRYVNTIYIVLCAHLLMTLQHIN